MPWGSTGSRPTARSPAASRSRLSCSSARAWATQASPSSSARATAGWNGAPETKVRNCLTAVTSVMSSAGPSAQPIFQPVAEKVLPEEEIRTVRSRMPGKVASGTCRLSSKTRCSYTSSQITSTSCRTASSAIRASSRSDSTVPVGLCGELISSTLVRGLKAASSSARSRAKSGPNRPTPTRRPPASSMEAA